MHMDSDAVLMEDLEMDDLLDHSSHAEVEGIDAEIEMDAVADAVMDDAAAAADGVHEVGDDADYSVVACVGTVDVFAPRAKVA